MVSSVLKYTTRKHTSRQNLGNATSPSLWPVLRTLWHSVLNAHVGSDLRPELTALLMDICLSLAKFTRNLVAQNPANQVRALSVFLTLSRFLGAD